jgi:hypothetical protein
MNNTICNELFAALAAAQSQLKHAIKDSTNPHFKSKYADLASCLDAIREPFAANKLAVLQLVSTEDGVHYLTTILAHASGQSIQSKMQILTTKNDAQGLGSGITYARRYALCAITGLGVDDDDGNDAVRPVHGTPVATFSPATGAPAVFDNSPEARALVSKIITSLGASGFVSIHKEAFQAKLMERRPPLNDLKRSVEQIIAELKLTSGGTV